MLQNNYQPHIDVLRALAVMLVILNHLDFSLFSGGFIGVDVFFVISGYLITKNIIKEKELTKKFSFREFYKRRIIRLAPAFLTVIFISSLFFLSVMTPMEINDYLKTVIASLILTSNIYYTSLLNDYFSITAKSTPLLHIWSLSLEEQFYLFWPLFIVLTLRFRRLIGLALIGCIIALSLYVSHELYKVNPTAAYYLLPSRVFEFAIGAGLAFIRPIKISNFQSLSLGSISIFGIIGASILINKNTIFPSYTALIPCFFSALFIYTAQSFGANNFKITQYLGKISYPMYLWHWPIIVYIYLFSINFNLPIKFLIILFTIVFSILTFELIEKKSKRNLIANRRIQIYIILPFLFTLLISISYINFHKDRTIRYDSEKLVNSIKCIDTNHINPDCYFGNISKDNIDILLIGDSHANAQFSIIDHLAKKAGLKGYEVTYSSTLFLPQIKKYHQNKDGNISNEDIFTHANSLQENMIKNNKLKFIVMGGFFPHNWIRNNYVNPNTSKSLKLESKDKFYQGLRNAIKMIITSGARPIIINDNPILENVDVNCNLRNTNPLEICYTEKNKYINDFKEWNQILELLKNEYPTLYVIDFNDIICREDKCYSFLNGVPLYRDPQHLNYVGSYEIAFEYLKTHENPFDEE